MNLNTMNVTRRTLLKGAGALGAAAALGSSLTYKPVKAFANAPNAAAQGETGEVYGHCRMCMLCGSCSFVATMKDPYCKALAETRDLMMQLRRQSEVER